ncbi:MAG: hypothetical protein IJ106_04300 [Parasporobacterium sp.]|nr:hypothetical protein [Parasporobacterium sp.]
MKRFLIFAVCLALSAALLAGCGNSGKEEETTQAVENDSAVLGTWTESYFDSGYTFNSDGSGLDTFWNLPFTYTAHDGVITITYDDETYGIDRYDYSVTESSITMTRQSGDGKSYTYSKS